jgi:PST family polysaccharide transporter
MSNAKRIVSNMLSLSAVQAATYVLPLITVPYLVRVLGPEKFGLIAFAQAFVQFFAIVTDYGFALSATRSISIHRGDREKLAEIFSSVMAIKAVLMVASFSMLCLIVLVAPRFRPDATIYFLAFGTIVGNAIFPSWFYQGIEHMRAVAITNIAAKAFFTVAVFAVVRTEADYPYVLLLSALGATLSGGVALALVVGRHGVAMRRPSKAMLLHELKEGWHVFLSTVAISFYTATNVFILGLFTSNTVVGYYSAGDKIVRAAAGIVTPLTQSVYPHISKLAAQSREGALAFVRRLVLFAGIPMLGVSLLLMAFAPQLCRIALGGQFGQSIDVLRVLAFLPFVACLSNILGIQVMLNFGLKSLFMRLLVAGGALNVVLSLLLVVPFQQVGIASSVIVTESLVAVAMFLFLERAGLHVMPFRKTEGAVQ